jgi:glycosyltransferase involved in cell wall biosynthesis
VIGTYPLVTTTFVDREIRALRALGIDVQVLAVRRPPDDAPLSPEQRQLQQEVVYLLPVPIHTVVAEHVSFLVRRPLRYLATLARLATRPHPSLRARAKSILHFAEGVRAATLLRGKGFEEVHAHFADRAATIALVVARLLDLPFSLSVHAGADIYVDPILLPEKVRSARRVLTCTAHNKSRLTAVVGRDLTHKIAVVPHGLDLATYRPQVAPNRSQVTLLAVGQCRERKGFAQLVEACQILRAEGYDFTCRIVGDGPQRESLAAMVHASGLDGVVQLVGARPHDEVLREYHDATVFVLPCIEAADGDIDGIPNVLIEAMACAVPVVSSDLPAIRELVTAGRNGVLVPPGDVAALADGLKCLLDQPARRQRLGVAGRETVASHFDAEVNARRFAGLLWPEHVKELDEVGALP